MMGVNSIWFMRRYARWQDWCKFLVFDVLSLPFVWLGGHLPRARQGGLRQGLRDLRRAARAAHHGRRRARLELALVKGAAARAGARGSAGVAGHTSYFFGGCGRAGGGAGLAPGIGLAGGGGAGFFSEGFGPGLACAGFFFSFMFVVQSVNQVGALAREGLEPGQQRPGPARAQRHAAPRAWAPLARSQRPRWRHNSLVANHFRAPLGRPPGGRSAGVGGLR